MKTKTKTQKKPKDFDEIVRAYIDADKKLTASFGLTKRIVIHFPKRTKPRPSFVAKIALKLLASQGGILDTEYRLIKK